MNESAEQEVRSADLAAAATVLKSSDASLPLKSPENQVDGEPLVSPMTLGAILSLHDFIIIRIFFFVWLIIGDFFSRSFCD